MKRIISLLLVMCMCTGCASWSAWDKTLGVTSTLATAADAYTTCRMLNNPNNYEVNPILGKHPSNVEVITTLAAGQAFVLMIAHLVPSWRKYILGGKTVLNGSLAIHNTTLDWSKDGGNNQSNTTGIRKTVE